MKSVKVAVLCAALGAAWPFDGRAADQGDMVAEAIGETLALAELCPTLQASDAAIVFLAGVNDIALDDAWLKGAVRFHRDRAAAQWGNGRTAESACEIGAELYGPDGSKGAGMLFAE